ncbi:MAG TPA: tryptophan synthase subunit alpha, partial [Nitrososphaeraceae archaeon]|nr:tryptophan synthase subunit alpha [Nitrososphaeraceae archaeon]
MNRTKKNNNNNKNQLQPTRKINRIEKKFTELKTVNQKALICYVVAGYPDIRISEDIITSLIKGGADIIEIGIPFSDPIADGSTIQDAIHNSLIAG